MKIIVYTRNGCPLCEKGEAKAKAVFGEDAVHLVDVDLDLDLLERYNVRVPVVATANGTVIDEGIISEEVMREYVLRST